MKLNYQSSGQTDDTKQNSWGSEGHVSVVPGIAAESDIGLWKIIQKLATTNKYSPK